MSFRDEHYLPFEGAGVISKWKLELNGKYPQFDYNTLSNVILHLKYTAREDAGRFREAANGNLQNFILNSVENNEIFTHLVSLKSDFPTEFYRLLHTTTADQKVDFQITKNHLPYWVNVFDILVSDDKDAASVNVFVSPKPDKDFTPNLKIMDIQVVFESTPLGDSKRGDFKRFIRQLTPNLVNVIY